MPLRSGNNPTNDATVLAAIKTVAGGYPSANTALTIAGNPIYVQREYDLLNTGQFPAVLISAGPQSYARMSQHTYNGQLVAYLDYYNRYDQTTAEFDDILAAIAADLELMKSNLESNDSLTIGGQALAVSMPRSALSPYAGTLRNFNGVSLVYRRLTMTWNLLDYDALS